ncbi:MAG: hypothetical protein WC851_04610 [Candidatus Shapirobacteria bacterium]|jgi:hypothetical protein
MQKQRMYEGWVVAHKLSGVEVLTVADRDGQCKGGGKRVTFEASSIEEARTHVEYCTICRTTQPVAGVGGPINTIII